MNQAAASILKTRMNKAIAIVLGVKEREIDSYLPQDVRDKLRKVVLDQFNEYHELCLDVMRSLDTGDVVLNQEYLDMIAELHSTVVCNE